jgi:hypothetical protein
MRNALFGSAHSRYTIDAPRRRDPGLTHRIPLVIQITAALLMIISRHVQKRSERSDWRDDNFCADVRKFNGALTRSRELTLGMGLLIVLVLALLGVIPTWPHGKTSGYGPSGMVGLLMMGRI